MRTFKILFVCVHNSFRSQLAQAIASKRYGSILSAQSAGLDTSRGINPLASSVGLSHGYDLSGHVVTDVFDLYKQGNTYDVVIAVCSKEAYERCPIFPGVHKRLHWPLIDPSAPNVNEEDRESLTHQLILELEIRIENLVHELKENR
jgi:arsenate reductase (thioredoxin)